MLDLLPTSYWPDPFVSFVENSCGDGAFVLQLVERCYEAMRKTKAKPDLQALACALNRVHGWDIQKRNVERCRLLVKLFCQLQTRSYKFLAYVDAALAHQIQQRDTLSDHSIPPCFEAVLDNERR